MLLYWHTSLAWYKQASLFHTNLQSKLQSFAGQGDASIPTTRPHRPYAAGRKSVLVHSGGFAAALVRQEYIQGIVYGDDAFEHTLCIDHRYSQ